jgi:predicted secreted protein
LKKITKIAAASALLSLSTVGFTQALPNPPLQNVVQLTASGVVEVQQDLLTVTLGTLREGSDANVVQSQLKQAVDAALLEVKRQEKAGAMIVRTGNFNLTPRWGRDGKLTGWQGQAEVVLEGQDFARITSAAGTVQSLTVSQLGFGLSRAQRDKAERGAQDLAIEGFKGRAAEIAHSFGFAGFSLREVTVNANEQGGGPRPRMMAMESKLASSVSPIPADAGNTSIVVNVSGTVQLK